MLRGPVTVVSVLLLFGVSCKEESDAKKSPAPAPAKVATPAAPAEPPAPQLEEPADPDEACAHIISVAWQGALEAPGNVTRDEPAARKRAEELLAQAKEQGADFRAVAEKHSDAKSRVRRGAIGTFTRDDWPEKHAAIKDSVFSLKVGEVGPIVKAPYGFAFARRCKVEKVHTRHILVRYEGAANAPDDVKRTKDEARALAEKLRGDAAAPGSDFAALAREHSEDGSAEKGGDLGTVGRGLFVPPYEEAAFALASGEVSAVVESKFGFHVIQRVE
jgi:peptidyl-prolyl cis-trans isomerase SurA